MRTSLHLLVLTLVVAAGGAASPAAAAPPVEVSGTSQVTSFVAVPGSARTTGTVVHQEFTGTSLFLTGSAHGVTQSSWRCLTVADRTFSCQGDVTFTGSVDGVGSGTARSRQRFTCDLMSGPPVLCSGRFVTTSGTGGLAGYHDVGTYTTDFVTGATTYTVRILPG